uniref:S-layer protein n=1 Tax=Geobacillus stearothermophilus TaxID=1422 RepID=SLAP_GEOSE|nr:RecName: Full=S-layer protein; AltName: Full=Surface layer protein; Flags: Precursor [Geobacillus stearothermophilus]CAA50409.1 surface layer protein [Geobacillus stearothermophilus]
MDRKKAVKLATASAIAASAFVAANPNASEAATDVATVVSQAKAQFKKAYYTYSHTVTETGEFPNINDVYAEYNKAKKRYRDAVALVNKAGGAKKDAYLADLQKEYETYVFKANPKSGEARVATYIDAYNYATKLDEMRQELEAAVQAKDLEKAEQYYHKIPYEIKTRTVILDRVYGKTTRDLLRSTFKAKAQELRDSLIYDITVAMKAREVQDAVKAGNLDKAKAAVDQINQYLPKVTDAFKTELTEVAKKALDADEAALTPKVESVSAINTQNKAVELTAVPVNGTLKLQLSAAANEDTVNVNTVRIYKVDGNIPFALNTADVSLSTDGKTITVDASTPFENNTEYKVVVKGIKDKNGKEFKEDAFTFKLRNDAVVTQVFGTNVTNNTSVNLAAGTFDTDDTLTVVFDKLLAPETVNSSNVTITDVETGKRIPVIASTSGSTITITLKEALVTGKQYKLAINNVKTLTGYNAEAYELVFTANASAPTVATAPTTLGGTTLSTGSLTTNVWGKLAGGVNEAGTYYPGLQFTTTFATKLDESTLADNFVLVEKESGTVVASELKYNADAKMVTLVPKADLKENTIYQIKIKKGLKSDKGIELGTVNEKTYEFKTQDLTAPTVISVTSKNGDAGLKVTEAQEFTVKFSENLNTFNATTVSGSTITYGQVAVVKAGANLSALTASDIIPASVEAVTGQDGTYKVKVAANQLERNQGYKLVVFGKGATAPVKDAANANTLATNYIYTFTTEGQDVTAPTVTKVFKGDSLKDADAVTTLTNVDAGQKFTIQFSEELKTSSGSLVGGKVTVEKLTNNGWVDAGTGTTVSVAPKTDANGKVTAAVVTLTGLDNNDKDAKLRLVVDKSSTDGIADVAGNVIKEKDILIRYNSWRHTVASVKAAADKDGQNASAAFPTSTAIDTTKSLLVEFNETDLAEVKPENIVVKDAAGNAVAGTVTALDGSTNKFVFTPSQELKAGTVYSVTIDGVRDKVGNTISKYITSFKTVSANPTLSSISIADGAVNVDRSKTITIEFSDSVPNPTITLKKADGTSFTNYTLVNVNNENKTYKIVFHKGVTLDEFTQYELAVSKDFQTGTDIDSKVTFITGSVATDEVKPALVGVGSWNGTSYTQDAAATRLRSVADFVAEPVALQFSEGIDLTNATVTVTNITDDKTVEVISKESVDADHDAGATKETLVINTVTPLVLDNSKTYKIVVSGVKDAAGNVADTITFYIK